MEYPKYDMCKFFNSHSQMYLHRFTPTQRRLGAFYPQHIGYAISICTLSVFAEARNHLLPEHVGTERA